ncbi:MAG: 23S rRNA (adenine(2030)-N(6))-methyltransferase RlmJ, partial [Pseudomonadota bacterium]
MNYRHAFHAGNFADVMKHVALVSALSLMQRKEKPFRVLDTHAGRGRYRLDSSTATRGGEAAFGIDALLEAPEAGRPQAVA